jgi:hypothetical protein
MGKLLLLLIAVFCVGLLAKILRRAVEGKKTVGLQPEAQIVVTFDEHGVLARYPNGEARSIQWQELTMVGITTTDEGPFAPDVFWGLHGPDGKTMVVYPGGTTGEAALLEELQRRLPDFDNEELIKAMGTATNARFLLWKRDDVSVVAT